jgi:SAM-dependent methyltransferase
MGKLRRASHLLFALLDPDKREAMHAALEVQNRQPSYLCPICGFSGKFQGFGNPVRPSARCPSCGALERHRLLQLAVNREFFSITGKRVLHFAPESSLATMIKGFPRIVYESADIVPGRAMITLDIERIELPEKQYDFVICSHVLEHVDDRKALSELFRILKPSGKLVILVPIVEGWSESFEDSSKTTDRERELYFGQLDHVRLYGSDFRDRVKAAGFSLQEFTANALDCVQFGLQRGEKIFLGTKCKEK